MDQLNVLGTQLRPCSYDPMTGYHRTGCCENRGDDAGMHTVCCRVTDDFLAYSASQGNDLTTPMPQYGFAGLRDGDRISVGDMVLVYHDPESTFLDTPFPELEVDAVAGLVRDDRCSDALDVLDGKRLPDGMFPVEWTNCRTESEARWVLICPVSWL